VSISAEDPAVHDLWRETEGALPNALALGYAAAGYLGGFLLMAADPPLLNVAGVSLQTVV
jgi:hypothetical protein